MTSLFPLLFFLFFARCAANEPVFHHAPQPVSNVCNCNCASQPSSEEKKDEYQRETDPANFDFLFTRGNTSDYVMVHELSHDLTAFTISLWMRTSDRTTPNAGIVSYATSSGDNTILLIDTDNLKYFVQQGDKPTGMKLNDGKWHHVLFTWENSAGAWKGYLEGSLVAQGSGLKKGAVISKTGTLVLGQDQDAVGGGFVNTQTYIGLLSRVNLWDRVLTQQELSSLNKTCNPGIHGNILKWDGSWLAGIRGSVQVMRPSSCNA